MNHQPIYWKMRNGKSIDIGSMDLNHLRNVLKMIVRNNQKNKISKKFKLNGDMAQEFHESYLSDEYDDRFDDDLPF